MWVQSGETFTLRYIIECKVLNSAPKSVSISRAAKKITLQSCDVDWNVSENTMATKEKGSISSTYGTVGNSNITNYGNQTVPGISMHHFSKDETFWQKRTRFVWIHKIDFVPVEKPPLSCAHLDDTSWWWARNSVTERVGYLLSWLVGPLVAFQRSYSQTFYRRCPRG